MNSPYLANLLTIQSAPFFERMIRKRQGFQVTLSKTTRATYRSGIDPVVASVINIRINQTAPSSTPQLTLRN